MEDIARPARFAAGTNGMPELALVVRQELDPNATALGQSAQNLQKVRHGLDHLRVAVRLTYPEFSLDEHSHAQPVSYLNNLHRQVTPRHYCSSRCCPAAR